MCCCWPCSFSLRQFMPPNSLRSLATKTEKNAIFIQFSAQMHNGFPFVRVCAAKFGAKSGFCDRICRVSGAGKSRRFSGKNCCPGTNVLPANVDDELNLKTPNGDCIPTPSVRREVGHVSARQTKWMCSTARPTATAGTANFTAMQRMQWNLHGRCKRTIERFSIGAIEWNWIFDEF